MDAAPHRAGLKRLPSLAAGFVALVCGAIVALGAWSEWTTRGKELATAEVELGNLAHSLTQHADDTAELAHSLLTGLVSALENDGAEPASIARLQAVLNARKPSLGRIRGLFVYDEAGRWLATTENVNLAAYNNSDRDYFRHHRASADRSMLIGNPVHSKSGGQWVITLSRRWNHPDGSFAGVVLATINAAYFSDYYSHFDLGSQGALALINRDGIILARSPEDGAVGRDMSGGEFFRSMRAGGAKGLVNFQSGVDGVQRLGFYDISERYPFMTLVTKAESEVLARWRREAAVRIALVFCLVTMLGVIGIFLVRQLVRGRHLAIELASQEANFRLIAEGSSDLVTRIGLDGLIQYASPSTFRVLGWHPQQLLGKPALGGINATDLPHLEEIVASLRRGEADEARVTYRTCRRDKSELWVESTLRVTRNVDGRIDGVVAITRDVTQQKDLQVKLVTLAIEDGLTGLANRRRSDERL